MKQFLGGLALGAVIVGGAAYFFIRAEMAVPLIFPPSRYYDAGETNGLVRVQGAVTGTEDNRVGDPNNFISVACWRERNECDVIDIAEFRAGQVSEPTLERWPIQSWTPEQIVVASFPPGQECYRVILTINRRTKRVEYSRQPQMNLARNERCRRMEMRLSRWTISEGVSWRDYPPQGGLGVPANAQGMQ